MEAKADAANSAEAVPRPTFEEWCAFYARQPHEFVEKQQLLLASMERDGWQAQARAIRAVVAKNRAMP